MKRRIFFLFCLLGSTFFARAIDVTVAFGIFNDGVTGSTSNPILTYNSSTKTGNFTMEFVNETKNCNLDINAGDLSLAVAVTANRNTIQMSTKAFDKCPPGAQEGDIISLKLKINDPGKPFHGREALVRFKLAVGGGSWTFYLSPASENATNDGYTPGTVLDLATAPRRYGFNFAPPPPTIEVTGTSLCVGDTDKSVSATLTNVPAGCTIDWGNANITTNATLAAGATSAKGNIGAGLTSSVTNIKAILKNAAGTPLAESKPYTVTVNPLPTATITPKELCSGAEITAGGGGTYKWTAGGSGTNAKIKAPTVTAATTTTYTVEVTSAQQCKATKSEQITVNPLPTVTLATSADRACVGGTDGVTLTASASGGSGSGYTYIWNPTSLGSAATANAKPGKGNNTYKVSVKDNKQCTSAEVSKNVTGFYLGLSLAANPGSVTFGGSSILTATASDGTEPYTYTWGQFAGQIGNEVTATNIQANTTYSVSVKDAKGCSSENNATASVKISGSSLVVTPPTNVGGVINTPFNAIV